MIAKVFYQNINSEMVDAESKIVHLLKSRREEGILQSEIHVELNLSKSTVSEIISKLEEERVAVRKKVTSKSYRVWLAEFSPKPVEGIVRIGILRASEYPKVVKTAEKLNYYVRVFESGIELTKSLVSGYVDIAASPLVTQAFFGVLMKNIRIFRIVAMNGSGVVLSNPESDCFGCSEFSTMERNLRRYLQIKGFKANIRYFKSAEDMVKNLREVRGVAIWEPYLTMLSEYKREMFSEVFGDFVCCTLATNNEFVELNSEEFGRFIDEYDSSRVVKTDAERLSQIIRFDKKVVEKSFSNYIFDVEQRDDLIERELEFLKLGSLSGIISL
jgi:predicted transcriptional regulator